MCFGQNGSKECKLWQSWGLRSCFTKPVIYCYSTRIHPKDSDMYYSLPDSISRHDYTHIAAVNRTIVAVGDGTGVTSEVLDLFDYPVDQDFDQVMNESVTRIDGEIQLSWQLSAPFPYSKTYKSYAVVSKGQQAFYFGGYNGTGMMKEISSFDPSQNEWSLVGELNQPRDFHSATLVGGRFLVLGGEL